MNYVEESVNTRDGVRLYMRRYDAESPVGHALIVHGFGEHSGRYVALTEHLLNAGYSASAYDHRGHGQSDGLAGHIESFKLYEEDLDQVIARLRSTAEIKKLFLVAHSMGGLIALRYLSQSASRSGSNINGAVISAPLLAVAAPVPAHKLMIGRVAARLAPRLRLDNEIDPSVLSRDPEVGRAYQADPLVNKQVSARWFSEAVQAMTEASQWAQQIKTPLLVMHGTDDRLASFETTRQVFQKIGSSDKEFVAYQGYYHELFNEPEKNEIYARLTKWLDSRAK